MEKNDDSKKFTFKITSYGKLLSITENATVEELHFFLENYNESLPKNSINEALSGLQIGETMEMNWHINNSKLLTFLPKYNRDIKLIRLS